ncbi:MAG: 3-deoxy-D-manno-octulosonic acid transferase, partial [Pseudomonadota bacterium]
LIWLHGASIGETASMAPLIAAIHAMSAPPALLVTSGTVTAAARLAETLPEGVLHHYVPVDTAPAVRRFLAHWRPDLAIWVESEFWPGLMLRTARAGVPMMLVNARLSAKSARAWARVPAMARRLVTLFDNVLTQDGATVERLVALGRPRDATHHAGNLKAAIPPPGCNARELEASGAALSGRPVWLAASTHPGEETVVIAAHRRLAPSFPGLVTLLAPRHPDRAEAIAAEIEGTLGSPPTRRSRGDGPPTAAGIWLADSLGEMGIWYRLSPVAFVGGSIATRGGHNPFEPAALGAAILHGPSTENFAPSYAALTVAGAARQVGDDASLAEALRGLLAHDGSRSPAAIALAEAGQNALAPLKPDVDAIAEEAMRLMARGTPVCQTRLGG